MIVCSLATSEPYYDDFRAASLDPSRWQVSSELDAWSIVRLRDDHLEVFGNGKWRGVKSIRLWRLPRQGQKGALTVTFKIRPFFHTVGGNPLGVFDSSVELVEETKSERKRGFGFLMTWPDLSEGGKYKVKAGGDWIQTTQPFTNSLTIYDFLQIRLGRKDGKPFCDLLYSQDGTQWIPLYCGDIALPDAVRILVASCWGALGVDWVQVKTEGDVVEEVVPIMERRDERTNSVPFVYAVEVPSGMAPKLDGRLDDPIWQKAPKLILKRQLGSDTPPSQETRVFVAYDRLHLYIAFDCQEDRMDLLRIRHKNALGPVWEDDCVEVFIQPDLLGQWFYYFHPVVNALGVGWDDYGQHQRWRCAADRREKGWTVEMSIPFATIGTQPPKRGDCWGINFTRSERPHNEYSTWSPVRGGFHDPERFGRIVFGTLPVRLTSVGLKEADKKGRELFIEVTSDKKVSEQGVVRLSFGDRFHKLPAPETGKVSYTFPSDLPAGRYRCQIELSIPNQPTIRTVVFFTHTGPGGLTSALWPVEVYDNTFYIADGQVAYFWLLVCDTEGKQQGYQVVLEVPEWMDILEPPSKKQYGNCPIIGDLKRDWTDRDGQRLRQITIQVDSPPPHTTIDKVELYMEPLLLWFAAKVPKGTKLPYRTFLYTTVRRSDESEPTRKTPLVVLPGEVGRQPRRLPIYIWLHGPAVPQSGWEAMLAHYQKVGVTGLQEGIIDPRFDELAKKFNISTMRSLWWYWWAPKHLKQHPEDAAINAEGKPADLTLGMVCPEVLLMESSPAFEEAFNDIVRADRGNPAGWNWNLEGPSVWSVCFCPRCLNTFCKFANLNPEQELTFEVIRSDSKLRDKWIEFALLQTERMVKKWSERIEKEKPGVGLYINSGSPVHQEVAMVGRLPWRKVLPYLRGGMFFRYNNSPIASRTTIHQESLQALEIVRNIGTDIWAMLSAGYMRVQEVYNYYYPDLITLQMLQHVAIGYRGIHFWSYRGFDGRFYNALARASRIIAQFEDWFLDGQKRDLDEGAVRAPEMVLPIAWKHDGRIALFLLNFDPSRDAEVTIYPDQLPSKEKRFFDAATGRPVSAKSPIRVPKLGVVVIVTK